MTQQTKLPTSPDWSTAPEWAKYFAINADGKGFWYDKKPERSRTVFDNKYLCRFDGAGKFDATNWKNSLQQRPQQ